MLPVQDLYNQAADSVQNPRLIKLMSCDAKLQFPTGLLHSLQIKLHEGGKKQ